MDLVPERASVTMLTVKQVAERLGISRGLVYKLVRAGELGSHRIGAAIRIAEDQLREYLDKARAGNEASPFEIRTFRHLDL